jgi:hypothetical protein
MNYNALVQAIVTLHREAVGRAALAVNRALILRNWMIGAHLVEFEQHGADRAAYGAGLLSRLSRDLRQQDVKGVSPDVVERMRLLYLHYPQLRMYISATVTRNSPDSSDPQQSLPISATPSRKSEAAKPTPLPGERLLQLSWSHLVEQSHLVELVRLDDLWKRA